MGIKLFDARRVNQEQKRINVDFQPSCVCHSNTRLTEAVFFKVVVTVFTLCRLLHWLLFFGVLIDPDNVTVNYTDTNGVTFENVLRLGGDGNYYFELPESISNYGTYKIASLVNHDGEEILIKTINGNSEVIVYHTTNIGSGLNPDLIVETDANGPTDNGVSHTVINIREAGQEIRLKTPPNPLAALDRAIAYVDSKRSHLGAMENRLESLIENHINTNINLSAARSRILDADYAVETSNMVKSQILQQAGSSMLAQANVVPESVLALLE